MASQQELLSRMSRIRISQKARSSHLIRYGEVRVLARKSAFCMDKEHLKEGRDSRQSGYQEICYVAACNLLVKRKEQCYTWHTQDEVMTNFVEWMFIYRDEGILSRTIPLSESAARGTLQMETSDEALLKALEQGILIACNSSAKVPDEQQTHSLVSNEYELPPIETAIH
uniref:Uncharacterized protein P0784G04.34 n=3 Tax=Oryza TaxID=4527 RepID=Q5F1V1_ORYSJ|nr:hypothetical protein [Oryza sativa Japonica Group]